MDLFVVPIIRIANGLERYCAVAVAARASKTDRARSILAVEAILREMNCGKDVDSKTESVPQRKLSVQGFWWPQ